MKKLDTLSRVELGTVSFLAGAVFFGTPAVLGFFLVEYFVPESWPALVRYGLALGGAGVAWILAFVAALSVEDFFSSLRRVLRRPTLNQAIADVERANRGNTFVAEPEHHEGERQRGADYRWVMKFELVAAFVVVGACLQHWYTVGGWTGWATGAVGILVAYWVISEILGRVDDYTDQQRKEIEQLRRQLAAFVCDANGGLVKRADIARLSAAIERSAWTRAADPLGDDWGLISRTWEFWRDGLVDQDRTRCANCGAGRIEHGADGQCPQAKDEVTR